MSFGHTPYTVGGVRNLSDALNETIPVLKTSLGMSDTETKVYIPIAIGGNMTAGSVAAVIGENLDKVKRTLQRLEKKGFVSQIEGIVPLYRAISPNMAVNKALTEIHLNLDAFKQKLDTFSESQEKQVVSTVDGILENQEYQSQQTKDALNQCETQILAMLQTHVQDVAGLANRALSTFSNSLETAMAEVDLELEEDLGLHLQELQKAIEKSQRKITASLKKASIALDKWLKKERVSSAEALSDFGVKAADLIDSAKSAVNQALDQSEVVLTETGDNVKQKLTDQSLNATSEAIAVLDGVTNDLATTITRFNEGLGEAVSGAETAFTEFYEHVRDSSKEHSELTKESISSMLEIMTSLESIIEEWKEEVPRIISGSSQTINTQLEQIATNDARYTETIKNTLLGYLDKVNSVITEDYDNLRLISTEIGSTMEEHLGNAKSAVISLVQKQSESNQDQFAESQTKLHTTLAQSSNSIKTSVNTSLDASSKEIGSILQGSATEFDTLTETISKKLSSAHRKILSTSDAKHKSMLTGLRRFTKDFETGIESKFDEIITTFNTTTDQHLKNANLLYNTLNNKLDERLTSSVETLSSHVKHAQQELDITIEDQTSRIDQHLQNIRGEFHVHLEDITRQFISMTQGLEATFNGLLSSQTIEAKDLVSSIHTGFKSSLKSELVRLEEDSLKLQQEYSSEIGHQIDEISESVSSMRTLLENLTSESRGDIVDTIAKTLENIENTIRTTKESLDTLESESIMKYQDSLLQASKDYSTSLNGIESLIMENFGNIKDMITSSVSTRAETVRKSLDTFSSETTDTQQRLLADTSKKLDVLSTKTAKDMMDRLEAYRASLTESVSAHSKTRTKVNDDFQLSIEERRSEASQAFDAASVWIESAVANLDESLVAVSGNLETGILTFKDDVTKAAEDIAKSIIRRSKDGLGKLTATGSELLQKADTSLRTHSSSFEKSCQKSLGQGKRGLTELPTTLGVIVDETISSAVFEANQKHHDVVGQLGDSISDYEVSVSSVISEYSKFLENTSKKIMKESDSTFEDTKESVLLANQHASRKFEQVGLDLKTQLSNRTHSLMEFVRGDITAKNSEMTDTASKTVTDANEETSKVKQIRNESLNKLVENTDKTLRRWAADQNKQTEGVVEYIGSTIDEVREVADNTIEALEAIGIANSKLLALPSDNTWFVTGKEEICGYMMDMTQRAKNSIILSVPEIACLDLKKLTKIKQARRKVLILPENEDSADILEKLKGWRIWKTKTPMLLAVMDKKELALGGIDLDNNPIAIVSFDQAYLQLYHDVLGPAIISDRKRSS